MMRVFVIELLICGVLLLTGCNTTAEKASDPNVFNCEESYTYSQETYSSDDIYYDYQEPHKTVENTLGIEEDIAFLYTYDYPDEGIGNGLIIMNNGDIFLADINVFDYVDNANFGEFHL